MKRLLLFAVILLYSCTIQLPEYTRTSFLDFNKYKPFLVSSLPDYAGYSYTSLGQIIVEVGQATTYQNGMVSTKAVSSQTVLDLLVNEAKESGANGIIGVNISYTPASDRRAQPCWTAIGIAIHADSLDENAFTSINDDFAAKFRRTPVTRDELARFIEQTVSYLKNNALELTRAGKDDFEVFDIQTKRYITLDAFNARYGEYAYKMLSRAFDAAMAEESRTADQ